MKRQLDLPTPKELGDGITQTKVEINYVYFLPAEFVVYTKQGNVVHIPVDVGGQGFIEKLENAVVAALQ